MNRAPTAGPEKERAGAACPNCGRPRVKKYSPFCSARCADVDLYRWLNGRYVIPASDEPGPQAPLKSEDE